ncbi:germination protein YpeB [Crassaminicella thermophila]|uniref:Germination protein YpeB n=1 Tax=Crassaminicella thermophila TaxID=2599308 RepID=A0A5C0SI88_CRATE|nr:germination protein YpeB [Crassaminicella thermophila]QEK12659.1 germination protein YpeB [Crassaminicella thermophila]
MKNSLVVVLLLALIVTGLWGYTQYQQNKEHNIFLENQFQRMFHDMVVDVENIQVNLSKVMIASAPKQNVLLFSDIANLCYDAQEKLTQLPIDHKNVSKTQKFLSQVGDLSIALARKNLEGKPLSLEEKETLQQLHNYSNYLSQQFISLQNSIAENGMSIGELRRKANKKLKKPNENMITTSFLNIEEKMQEYPELIYDGPFSEHIKKQKSKLNGRRISKNEIKKIAEEFLGNKVEYKADLIGETNSRIPAYTIELKPKEKEKSSVTMAITKNGGYVLWMLNTREISEAKISEKRGLEIAKDFLKKRGYKNMVPTYSEKYDGQMVINFACMQDNVIIYTDLIKVKVGLDNGEIVGFEAEGYLFNHHERNISKPKINIQEAKDKISIDAKVIDSKLVIIPNEGGKEILCYEFKANYKGDTFLIYINAETGEEQKILQVIIKENGVLML